MSKVTVVAAAAAAVPVAAVMAVTSPDRGGQSGGPGTYPGGGSGDGGASWVPDDYGEDGGAPGGGGGGSNYNDDYGVGAPGQIVLIYSTGGNSSPTHTLQFWSADNANNVETAHTVTFTVNPPVDNVPPVTTSSFNPTSGANYNATQTVTLTATDNQSGVKAIYYKVDSGSYAMVSTSTATFTISGDTTHTFSYYAADNANNTETAHVSNVFRIDTIPPTTTSNFNPAANALYSANQPVTLTATDSVNSSGVAATYYRIDSGVVVDRHHVHRQRRRAAHLQLLLGRHATNKETTHTSNTFRIDTTPPVTTSNAAASYSGTATISLTATDGVERLRRGLHLLQGRRRRDDDGHGHHGQPAGVGHHHAHDPVLVGGQCGQQGDDRGRRRSWSPSNDITPPTTVSSFNPAANANYNANQPVTLTATDNTGGSGVKAIYYKIDSGSYTMVARRPSRSPSAATRRTRSATTRWTTRPRPTPRRRTSRTIPIDTVAPTTTSSFNPASNAIYNSNPTVTLTASDTGGSGVAATYYRSTAGRPPPTPRRSPSAVTRPTRSVLVGRQRDQQGDDATPRTRSASTHAAGDHVELQPGADANYNATPDGDVDRQRHRRHRRQGHLLQGRQRRDHHLHGAVHHQR